MIAVYEKRYKSIWSVSMDFYGFNRVCFIRIRFAYSNKRNAKATQSMCVPSTRFDIKHTCFYYIEHTLLSMPFIHILYLSISTYHSKKWISKPVTTKASLHWKWTFLPFTAQLYRRLSAHEKTHSSFNSSMLLNFRNQPISCKKSDSYLRNTFVWPIPIFPKF